MKLYYAILRLIYRLKKCLKICIHEQILSPDDIQRICKEIFPMDNTSEIELERFSKKSSILTLDQTKERSVPKTPLDCYNQNMLIYANNPILQTNSNNP